MQEQLFVDGMEILYRDSDTLRIADEFALSDSAIETLKSGANNISIVNYLLGSVPLAKDHALLKLRDFVEGMLFFRSLDYREFIGFKEGEVMSRSILSTIISQMILLHTCEKSVIKIMYLLLLHREIIHCTA